MNIVLESVKTRIIEQINNKLANIIECGIAKLPKAVEESCSLFRASS